MTAWADRGCVNDLKGGIVFADMLTAVSGAYAWEITTSEGGHGLDGVLRQRKTDLVGILNGIDYDVYNPAKDQAIHAPYTWRSLGRKQEK